MSDRANGVAVIGAGPVGLVAACELLSRGVAVRIIDRLAAPTEQSRAIVVHARSLEMFDRMGLVDQVIGSGVRTVTMQMFASGHRLAKVDLDRVDSAYPFSVTTPQTETERILTQRFDGLGGAVSRGVELTGLTQDQDAVHLTLRSDDGASEQLDAAYVIGADGSHSTVRDQIGSRLLGSFKGERFILGDVQADHDLDPSSFYTYFAADGPLIVFPMKGQRMRIMAQVHQTDGEPVAIVVTQDELQRLVDQRSEGIRITSSHWLTAFEIHHAQVPAYRSGRVFLAGDAAHVHSPAGGQGMNTGMQDAFNLAWKLALAINGEGGQRLLDSYHDERHPVAAKVIEFSDRLTRIGLVHGELATAFRDHAVQLAVALAPVQDAVATQTEEVSLAYRDSPIVRPATHPRRHAVRAGDHFPPVPDPRIQRELSTLCQLAPGHLVITIAPEATPPPAAATSPGWRQLLVSTHGETPAGFDHAIADPSAVVAKRLGRDHGGRVVLRPDGYIGYLDDLDDFDLSRYEDQFTHHHS